MSSHVTHESPFNSQVIRLADSPLRDASYVAARLGISQKSVLQYAREGRLPCIRIGKHVRFVLSDIEAALGTMRSTAAR